jgi:hypothetical protein
MFRLLFGIFKGLLIGAILGGVLVASGMGEPGALIAYPAAAAAAVLVSMIAGKKIWEADGRVQFMLKAVAGLFLGPGLMWLARTFASVPLPNMSTLPGVSSFPGFASLPAGLTLGSFAITSLAMVAAVVGGFYDLDNTPAPEGKDKAKKPAAKVGAKRIDPELAALTGLDASEIESAEAEAEERRAKK